MRYRIPRTCARRPLFHILQTHVIERYRVVVEHDARDERQLQAALALGTHGIGHVAAA